MNWKQIFSKKGILLFASSISLCSCTDFLTRDHPTGVTDDDFWKTTDECNAALGACQYWPHGTMHYTSPYICWIHMEALTDNAYWSGNYQTEIVNFANGSATTATGGYADNIWINYYQLIRRCNRFLEHVDEAYFVDEAERERMRAEARTYRAWYHMQLLLYYGKHDGIPIVDKSLNGDEIYGSRNTVEECLNFINSELDDLIAITDDDVYPFIWDENRRGRMCRAYALVLKMDLNLQFKNYELAKQAAKAIIDEGVFELHYAANAATEKPGESYTNMFSYSGQQNKERIMFTNSGCAEVFGRNVPISLGGQGVASILKSFVDTYETADGKALEYMTKEERIKFEQNPNYRPRDPRMYATVVLPGDTIFDHHFEPFADGPDLIGKVGASRTGYFLKKYLCEEDRTHPYGGSLYFPLYRYAEVLLDYVECLVETGDWQNPDVEKYLNMIRKRAGMPNMDKSIYNSQEKVRELYRRERRVELAFEGKRYWDIRRWEIGNEVMSGPIYGAYDPRKEDFVVVEERNCSFPKYDSWPIPLTEETANPNIDQPTGW